MIRITAKRAQGFYRCGVFHPAQTTDHPDDAFTPDQIETLRGEPQLDVRLLEGEPENPPRAAGGPEGAERALHEREQFIAKREEAAAAKDRELGEREAALARKEWLLNDPSFREARLKAAIRRVVDGGNKDDMTKDRAPTTEAVEREAGENITAAERTRWFEELYPDGAAQ